MDFLVGVEKTRGALWSVTYLSLYQGQISIWCYEIKFIQGCWVFLIYFSFELTNHF